MKRFWKLGVLGVLLCALQIAAEADAKKAPAKVPVVTRDNFVSLEYFVWQGSQSGMRWHLDNNGLRVLAVRPPITTARFGRLDWPTWSQTMAVSKNQMDEFLNVMKAAQLPRISGVYHEKSPEQSNGDYLTLTVSDEKNRDQNFIIENHGKSAPRGFFQVVEALKILDSQKFPIFALPQPDESITSQNFQTLTLETSGGIAGIHSLLEIKMRPSQSSIGGAMLNWSQTMGGQTAKKEAALGLKELDQLNSALNAANLPNLNGKNYQQPKLADGFGEVLTVTLQDGRKFTVQNYGDTAPTEYYALTQYLRELQRKKIETGETQ